MALSSTFYLILAAMFTAFTSSLAMGNTLLASTISAAPALLPDPIAPLSTPPALSPDISPLFPTPAGSELSPTESSIPLIPSSPSPPNPDAVAALGPSSALSPVGILPDSSSVRMNLPVFFIAVALVFGWVF